MNQQQSPNRWSCLPTSFAMVLDISVEKLLTMIGHDGSEVYWPELPEPCRRRGFHPQELIYVTWLLGYTVTPFEAIPQSQGRFDVSPIPVPMWVKNPEIRLLQAMAVSRGVITGETQYGQKHALAWSSGVCFDPNGQTPDLSKFKVECFWAIKSR